jgi:hypothetical protein
MNETTRSILDEVLPHYDVTVDETLVVDTDVPSTYRAAKELDFLSVRSPLVTASMWVRGLPAKVRGNAPTIPRQMRLSEEGLDLPGWTLLGERPDEEIAFGAVGRFWQRDITWHDVPREEFAEFMEPGWGKIAASFSVRPYGEWRTLLTYGCRTATTDAESRQKFGRYWMVIRPFVRHIMHATLHTIADDAVRPAAVQL